MIKAKEIQFAMCEMDYRTLKHKINLYIEISVVEVLDIISKGVQGGYLKYVAYVLRLKKYIPEGWEPIKRVIEFKERAELPKQLTFGNLGYSGVKGTEHYKKQGRFWQEDDINKLTSLYKAGKTCAEIAVELDRKYDSINSKIRYMKANGTLDDSGEL